MMLPPSPALAKLEELDEGMEAMKRTYGDKEFVNTFELMVDIIKTLAKGGNQ
jgi:hypothetical protein